MVDTQNVTGTMSCKTCPIMRIIVGQETKKSDFLFVLWGISPRGQLEEMEEDGSSGVGGGGRGTGVRWALLEMTYA